MKKILLSVVCYDNEDEIISYGKKIENQNISENLVLIVTCNKVTRLKYLIDSLKSIKIESHVFNPKKNIGYLSGALYGISQYEKNISSDFEWIFISNTDISFESNNFFEYFYKSNISNEVWCVGPRILLSCNKKEQNPFLVNRPTMRKMNFWRVIYSKYFLFKNYYYLSRMKGKIWKRSNSSNINEEKCVYSVHGSAFFIRRECFLSLYLLEEKTFMYEEELLISEEVLKNKKKVLFLPDILIYHNENQTTGKIDARKKQEWIKESFNMIYNNYFKNRS